MVVNIVLTRTKCIFLTKCDLRMNLKVKSTHNASIKSNSKITKSSWFLVSRNKCNHLEKLCGKTCKKSCKSLKATRSKFQWQKSRQKLHCSDSYLAFTWMVFSPGYIRRGLMGFFVVYKFSTATWQLERILFHNGVMRCTSERRRITNCDNETLIIWKKYALFFKQCNITTHFLP